MPLKTRLSQLEVGIQKPTTGRVVKPGSVKELHEIRVSPAFTANTDLEFFLFRDSTFKAGLNQFPHTLLTETSEWVPHPGGLGGTRRSHLWPIRVQSR